MTFEQFDAEVDAILRSPGTSVAERAAAIKLAAGELVAHEAELIARPPGRWDREAS